MRFEAQTISIRDQYKVAYSLSAMVGVQEDGTATGLVQEGVLGLMHAAEKFDARKGFRFSTYATYWIRWAIGQAIMNESRTIRLPSPIWYALQRLVRAQAFLWQQKQKEPSPDELAEAMQCEKEQVLVLLQLQHEIVSLEQPVYSEHEVTLFGDQIAAPDDTEQREQQREVGDLLKHLSPQERRVIELRYQVGQATTYSIEDIPLPYTEVGRRLDMTPRLVKAVEERAFVKMRFWAEQGKVSITQRNRAYAHRQNLPADPPLANPVQTPQSRADGSGPGLELLLRTTQSGTRHP